MTARRVPAFRVLLLRLVALYWAGQTFWLSSDSFRSSNSRAIIAELTRMLGLDLSSETLWLLNTIARKSAHVAEYAVFSILLYFAFRGGGRPVWDQRAARISLMAACAFALLDELHQGFSIHRGSSPVDFALDCLGAAMGISLVYGGFRALRATALARQTS
jgi:VanZ family protein